MVENTSASSKSTQNQGVPQSVIDNVYVQSDTNALTDTNEIHGYNFDNGIDYERMFKQYVNMGFQASALGRAIEEINKMIKWRLSDEPVKDGEDEDLLTQE